MVVNSPSPPFFFSTILVGEHNFYFKTKVSVEDASCNKKQEPLLKRRKEQCSPVGADGRDDGRVGE